jgi:predicted HTH transcriptional regulator
MKSEVILFDENSKKVEKLTPRQRDIFNILQQMGEIMAAELKAKLHEDVPEWILRYDLGVLKKQGLVDSSGTTKNTVWFVKKELK